MNEKELKQVAGIVGDSVKAAIAPLAKDVAQLKAQFSEVYAAFAGARKQAESVQDLQHIYNSIPKELREQLGVQTVLPDPKDRWFQLVLVSGERISVKKLDDEFRLRVRNQAGDFVQEIKVPLNGLNAALKALAS